MNDDRKDCHPDAPAFSCGCGGFRDAHPHGAHTSAHGVAYYRAAARRLGRSHHFGIREVLYGIRVGLIDGKMPGTEVPQMYRNALADLVESRSDRTDGRKSRFDDAMTVLTPALAIADADSDLFSLKRVWKIDQMIATLRRFCSSGPASLPPPEDQFPEKFQFKYVAHGGEMIIEAAMTVGLENPAALEHPAYGYTLCMRLRAGDVIFVPMPMAQLEAMIESCEDLIESAEAQLQEVLTTLRVQQKDLDNTLLLVEAISIFANIAAALGNGIVIAAKAAKAGVRALRFGAMATEYAVEFAKKWHHVFGHWNEHFITWAAETAGHSAAELFGMGIEVSKSPEGFWARHPDLEALSRVGPVAWLSPNFWTPLLVAGYRGKLVFAYRKIMGQQAAAEAAKRDAQEALDYFWRGKEATDEKARDRFEQLAEDKIEKLKWQIAQARSQLKSPVYTYKQSR